VRFIAALTLAAAGLAAQPVKLDVDATDAPRRLIHVHMTMPAKPGPLTLLYPQWIPGEHGPTGPVIDMVGFEIHANGQRIPWTRDSVNMFAYHVTVPEGATSLDITFDQLSPPDTSGFSSGASMTSELAVLSWNQLVLYPEGPAADQIQFQANLRVPQGWRYGTALPIATERGNEVEFQPAPLNTLIDSPVSTGRHYRTIELARDGNIVHYLHLAADSDRALEISSDELASYKSLVAETGALFGSRHYRSYHFLYTLSDYVASFGLEHHESSDDRVRERTLLDDSAQRYNADLLPHEFVHSWNGKFRRPAGLATPDYSEPMKGNLLWVYEGLTQYLGEMLTARTGLLTPQDLRAKIALVAAQLDREPGRMWRPLQDTATAAQLLYDARDDYANLRRGVDYYDEGTLLWLDADVTIRQLSKGAKSLNDFCRSFEGGPGGKPELKTYTFDDVVAALNAVQPYDWEKFFRDRIEAIAPHAPLGGIENGGWKLVYRATKPDLYRATEDEKKEWDLSFSIGLTVKDDGVIPDVIVGSPAHKAGLAPNDKIIAVNNRAYTGTILREAIQATANGPAPLELLIKRTDYYSVHKIEYQGGEKYPHLERDESKPDLLSKIMEPLAKK
jgi:predicted metalloprotease with PDZ domain